jgi:hypothetical protein
MTDSGNADACMCIRACLEQQLTIPQPGCWVHDPSSFTIKTTVINCNKTAVIKLASTGLLLAVNVLACV